MMISTCSNALPKPTKKLLTHYYWLVTTMKLHYVLKVDDDSFARLGVLNRKLKNIIDNNNSYETTGKTGEQ